MVGRGSDRAARSGLPTTPPADDTAGHDIASRRQRRECGSRMSRTPWRAGAVAALAAVVTAVVPAASASADVASDGLWYFDVLKVQAAHDAGFTGEGVTIAVIDSVINPDIATLRGTDLQVQESPECTIDGEPVPVVSDDISLAHHGTNVTSMIIGTGAGDDGQAGVKGVAPGATVLYYRNGTREDFCDGPDGEESSVAIGEAIDDAVTAGADIISMSLGFSYEEGLYDAVVRAQREGVILVTALSNQGDNPGPRWSSELNGAVNVQAIDRTGALNTHDEDGVQVPNSDPVVDVAAPGVDILAQGDEGRGWSEQVLLSGTSLATPIVAGFLAVTSQKYPDATPNQLIQSLIHNTGVEDHELMYTENDIGYGIVSLTHLLRKDPAQYPDVNPLLVEGGDPSIEDIAAGSEEVGEPGDASPAPTAGPTAQLLVLGGVALLLIVGVVLTLVLVRRRRARGAAG
jgi:subtilisin family serine protease